MISRAAVVLLLVCGCDCRQEPLPDECRRIADLPVQQTSASVYQVELEGRAGPFAIVGDTQRTSFQECLVGREVNDAETTAIVAAIAERRPAFVVHVGDLVFDGSSAQHWAHFDATMAPLRQRDVPVLPVLGNHEYYGDDEAALRHVRRRFASLAGETHYERRHGRIAMLFVDSNHDEIDAEQWAEQSAWFRRRLSANDEDPDIDAVVVFLHHPPYTNSTVVSGDEAVRRDLVGAFCDAHKTAAMFSGHAHGYERFEPSGCGQRARTFVVTAGGGGPRPGDLRDEVETGHEDAYEGEAPRPFHFLWVEPQTDRLEITAVGLDRGQSEVRDIDRFDVPFAAR